MARLTKERPPCGARLAFFHIVPNFRDAAWLFKNRDPDVKQALDVSARQDYHHAVHRRLVNDIVPQIFGGEGRREDAEDGGKRAA